MLMAGNLADAFKELATDDYVGLDFRTPRCWRALIAISSREQKAADWLREAHIRAYWPNYAESEVATMLPNGRPYRRGRLKALIPGFIFVAVRDKAEIDLGGIVEQTPGIIGYMRDGGGYAATVTERDIECIRGIESDKNKPSPKKHVHNFKMSQRVRFRAAESWIGKIEEFCPDGRIGVGVPLLGRIAVIKALPHQIEPV
jgi:transcription antitermination factor NusG